jgi:glycosyltransferase involved in cell wall biosynthesis
VKLVTNVQLTSPTGGLEMHVLQVGRELAHRGHRVHLLYEQPGPLLSEYRSYCASVTQLDHLDYHFPSGRRGRLFAQAQLAPAIWAAARRGPDVFYGNRVLASGWAIPAGIATRRPVVLHEHGYADLGARRIDLLNRHVDRFLMISRFVAAPWLADGLDPAKVEIVHNGIDPADYPVGGLEERAAARRALGLPAEAFVVAYVGRLDAEKGVDVLLEAWRALDRVGEEARLLVVGSSVVDHDGGAHLSRLRRLADDDVVFLPARRDVVTPLHAADVSVVPSVWDEPFGRSVIEGLATGRPVIATRVGGIPEILVGPLEDLLVERRDVRGLAARLAVLRGWQVREPELADRCTSRVRTAFTLERMVDRVESTLLSVT